MTHQRLLVLSRDPSLAERLRSHDPKLRVQWTASLLEFGTIGQLGSYDGIIADLELEPVNGLEIAEYASHFFPGLPVVLLAQEPCLVSGELGATVLSLGAGSKEILRSLQSHSGSRVSFGKVVAGDGYSTAAAYA